MKKGVRLVIEAGNPHLAAGDHIIPLKQDPRDSGMCLMCSLDTEFQAFPREKGALTTPTLRACSGYVAFGKPDIAPCADSPGVAFAAAVDANTWHRRLGHLNFRSDTIDDQSENPLLREEIRRMRHNNVIHEELQQQAVNCGSNSAEDNSDMDQSKSDPNAGQAGEESGVEPVPPQGVSRSLEVTPAATRRMPNASDAVSPVHAPSSLRIDMDDSGGACATATHMRPDPSALTTAQLLGISSATVRDHAGIAPNFAHLEEESPPKSRAYVFAATGIPIQRGFLEEEYRAIKIPEYLQGRHQLAPSQAVERSYGK